MSQQARGMRRQNASKRRSLLMRKVLAFRLAGMSILPIPFSSHPLPCQSSVQFKAGFLLVAAALALPVPSSTQTLEAQLGEKSEITIVPYASNIVHVLIRIPETPAAPPSG